MKITHLVARLRDLSEQLTHYPSGTEASKMVEDEIKEIMELVVPNRWKK